MEHRADAVDPFVVQLASLCRAQPTRPKWVFVPSHALGHTLGERLAREGVVWANLRFTTPLDLALAMAAPFLVERGLDPTPHGLGPALVMRLLEDLPDTTPRYFAELGARPEMAEALWATLHELRMAGLSAADLARGAFVRPDKRAEVIALARAWEAHLLEHRQADEADVYREALDHVGGGPVLAGDFVTESPNVAWAPLEARLIDAVAGERLAPAVLTLPGLTPPRRLHRPRADTATAPASDAERLAWLARPAEAPPPLGDGTLQMFKAGSREAEAEEALRRALHSGRALDQVEIACAAPAYVLLLSEAAQRHDLPMTFSPGLPAALTRPGRALLGFCAWVEAGFPASGLRRLLQSGDVRLPIDDLSPGQAARLLSRSSATWGRSTYAVALSGLARSERERAADPEVSDEERARRLERAARAEALAQWTAGLIASVPGAVDGRLPMDAWLDASAAFVSDTAAKASDTDAEAAVALAQTLRDQHAMGVVERPVGDAVALVRRLLEGLRVGADRARPGHLHVTMLRDAGHAGRPFTFVLGLEEAGVLPAAFEDPVLLDAERVSLDPALATSTDRVEEARWAVLTRLGALGGQVCVSYACRDVREHRDSFASWLMVQIFRVMRGDAGLGPRQLDDALGQPVSLVPAAPSLALSESGWWLARLNGIGPSAMAAVLAGFPALAQGEAAARARESDVFTAYDGLVPAAAAALDPRVSGRPVSPTMLEDLARCPFRHFLRQGLGIEAADDAEPDRDRWLDPAVRGGLLHALYAAIMREVRADGGLALARHGPRLAELGEDALATHRALVPSPSDHVFARERQEVLEDLRVFLQLEARERRSPVGFEVGFGAGAREGEPLAQAEPVTIDLGGGLVFRLRGRIDRVDRLRDGTYEVIDYKTGGYWAGDFRGTFRGGRMLQHALYGLAAETLLRKTDASASVSAGCYYLPTVRGDGERVVCRAVPRAQVAAVLLDLFDVVAAGAFFHAPEVSDCKWCDHAAACGKPLASSARKLANPANAMLDPYRRLQRRG
jgi:ATP-dependent helicase/nuclease subunit B